MSPAKIRYKGISFEHNPKSLSVSGDCSVRVDNTLFDTQVSANRGRKNRVIRGKGVFLGEGCLDKYTEMSRIQKKKDSGILSLPDIEPFYAYFTSLELVCDKTPDYVEYVFEFTEDMSKSGNAHTSYSYVCADGESLWDAAYKHGVDIDELVRINPQIRFINDNLVGKKVRIC
jgi:hypothetical protein